jgi:putative ABC transport system permease protein
MTGLLQDIQYALRTLAKKPGFAAAAVGTLALGIGANTAIFSVVNAVLLRPLPFPNPDRLVLLWEKTLELPTMMVAYPDYLDWRDQNGVFESLAVYNRYRSVNLTGSGDPERVSAAAVSASFFATVGVQPEIGRGFLSEEDRPDARAVVLLHGFFERRFGADKSLVGRTVTLEGSPHTVVGVMPRGYRYPAGVELLVTVGSLGQESLESRNTHPGLVGLGRLRQGVTLDRARGQMRTIAARLASKYPDSNAGVGVEVAPLSEILVGSSRPTLVLLLAAVGFVLLIACANVASLLLARAIGRGREMAIRAALGAGRGRLTRQLVTESLVLSLAGGGLGLLAAGWSASLLSTLAPHNLPGPPDLRLDARVLAFTLLVSMLTGLLFGFAPAIRVARGALQASLKEDGWGLAIGPGRRRARGLLVAAEVAISVLLLIGAGLMVRSLAVLQRVEPGFDPAAVAVGNVSLPKRSYPTDEAARNFFEAAIARLKSSPGIRAAAAGDPTPFGPGGWQVGITVEGVPNPSPNENPLVNAAVVSPDYFRALAIPLTRGRFFSDADDGRAPRCVIVSRAMVERFWPGADPLGKAIKFGPEGSKEPWIEVVGVAGDVKQNTLTERFKPQIYVPMRQTPVRSLTLVARSSAGAAAAAAALRRAVAETDGSQPIWGVAPLESLLAETVEPRRFSTALLTAFAALALLLAMVGIYGVLSHSVGERRREIGLRLTLGADASNVVRLVVTEGMRPVLLGLAAGALATIGVSRLLARLLFEVSSTDPGIVLAALFVVGAVALLASYLPARRASRVDPMEALRSK